MNSFDMIDLLYLYIEKKLLNIQIWKLYQVGDNYYHYLSFHMGESRRNMDGWQGNESHLLFLLCLIQCSTHKFTANTGP